MPRFSCHLDWTPTFSSIHEAQPRDPLAAGPPAISQQQHVLRASPHRQSARKLRFSDSDLQLHVLKLT
jgi:hypothetical protein